MSESWHLYLVMTRGVSWLNLMLSLGGFTVCLSYRRLSPGLIVASAGFVGLAASEAIYRLAPIIFLEGQEIVTLYHLAASFMGLVSMVLLIFGLSSSFADIRRRLALAMEPPHVRK